MNNAKIWLVVKPTVGVPLFLTAVAVGSFSVHLAVLRNTTWVSNFLNGQPLAKTASIANPTTGGSAAVVVFRGNGPSDAAQEAVVVLPDGRTAKVVFSEPETTKTAMAGTDAIVAK